MQIEIAAGKNIDIKKEDIKCSGHAIECRIKAIDTENNFFPSIGRINIFNIPSGNNIRIDTYVYQGYELKPYRGVIAIKIDGQYEAIIAKVN